MGLGTKLKSALNGDKTRDGPRKANTFESTKSTKSNKAPTPPAKTPGTVPTTTPGAFPAEETPRSLTTHAADVNTAWNEPKPVHPQPHSTLRSPSPDAYTFRTAESEAGFTADNVSQVSDDDRTSIGETIETPMGPGVMGAPAPQPNRLSKDPKYPYWGATGTGNGVNNGTSAAGARVAMTGTNNSSPRSAHTATMNGPSTTGVVNNDGHVKFDSAPRRHVGEHDIYTGAGPTDSTYGELGNAGYDSPASQRDTLTPRGMNAAVPPPIPEKVSRQTYTGTDAYNMNGFSGTNTGTGLGMTNGLDREPVMDRETKIQEYGAPTSSEHRRQASTSTRGLAAAAMARRHRDDDMREYETSSPTQYAPNNTRSPEQHTYNSTQSPGQYNQAQQPHSLNTSAYTHPDNHVGNGMVSRGASVTSPNNHYKHSPKDSGFGSGDDYSPASAKGMPAMNGMGDGHFGPGHQGAKVVHRCHNCGVDNDISRYFRKEVVYRLGD